MAINPRRRKGLGQSTLGMSYTLDDLENDERFQEISERFLTSIGERGDDIFEYFRDSDFNLAKGLKRMVDTGNFTTQQKQDYKYLRETFDGADMGSMKQYFGLIKDAGIDMLFDPTLLASVLFTPVSGGTSLATRLAAGKAAQKALKGLVKINTEPSKITAGQATALVAGEGAAWTGSENYFRQNAELNTKMRKAFSSSELAGTTATGLLAGGVFGGLANKNQFFKERMERLYTNDGYRKDAGSDFLFNARRYKDRMLAKTIGTSAHVLKPFAEFSPTARLLGQKFNSEFNRDLTKRSKQRIGYSYGEDVQFRRGNYKEAYEDAIRPLYATGRMSPELGEQVVTLLRGGKVPNASQEVIQVSKNLRKFYDGIRKDALKAGMKVQDIKNYFPRSWDRQAISDNPEKFKKMLTRLRTDKDGNKFRIVDRDKVDDVVEGMLNKKDELYSSHSNLLTQARVFENLDDNVFKEFLSNDLHMITTDYYMNAARTIEHKIHFLGRGLKVRPSKVSSDDTSAAAMIGFRQDNVKQFQDRFIDKIEKEMKAAGRKLTRRDKEEIIDTYKSITGQVDYFRTEGFQALYDGTKLANAMAYLPLATVSSLSEAFITLGKAPTKSAIKGMQDAIKEGGHIFQREMGQILKEKHQLTDREIMKEMNRVFLAVDEAVADLTNRLDGDGLQNEFLKKGSRGFYRLNLLIPWTKTVQLAAFSTGKDMIFENLTKLSTNKNIIGKELSENSRERIRGELFDLGVNVDEGLKFIKKYGNNINKTAQNTKFYKNDVIRGAGRFTNGVILQTGREFGSVGKWMTNPKVDILTQFLRYPTVFGNTVLRNFARSTITDPAVNAPKVTAFSVIATNVAMATNYWRASEEERKRIDRGEDKVYDTIKAVQRVGLLGPSEYFLRGFEGIGYGQSPLTSIIGTGGPILGDVIGMLLYDRGFLEQLARKAPLTGTRNIFDRYLGDIMEEYTGVREPFTPLQEAAKPYKLPRGVIREKAQELLPDRDDKDKNNRRRRSPQRRKPFSIGGKVSPFILRKLNTSKLGDNLKPIFYKKQDDMEGGPSDYEIDGEITFEFDKQLEKLIKSFYMDRFGNVSPVLRSLAEDAPSGMTGPKLIKFLKKEATRGKGTAVTKDEMDYLDIEQYIMDHPYESGIEIAENISDRRLEIVPFVRTETGLKDDLKFDTTTRGKDNLGIDIEVIKVDLSDVDRALGSDYFIDRIDRDLDLFAVGNENIGYKIDSNDDKIKELIAQSELEGTLSFEKESGIMSSAEAKIQLQTFMQEEDLLGDYGADYSVRLKNAVDDDSPGGKNYRETIYNVQGRKVTEVDTRTFHFTGSDETTQFGHAVSKDRKLKKGDVGTISSRNIEELQSDYFTYLYDYGIKTPKNEKLAKEIFDETNVILDAIDDKIKYIEKEFDYTNPKTIDEYNELNYIDFTDLIKLDKAREGGTKKITSEIKGEKVLNTIDKNIFSSLPEDLQELDFNLAEDINDVYALFGDEFMEEIMLRDPSQPIELQARLFKDLKNKGEEYVFNLLPVKQSQMFENPNQVSKYLKEEFNKLLLRDLKDLQNSVATIKAKYGNPENLIIKNPVTKKFYKRILERQLYEAAKDGQDALSVASGDLIHHRYGTNASRYTKPLYNEKFPNYMKELAEEYGGTFEKLEIDRNDLINPDTGESALDFNRENNALLMRLSPNYPLNRDEMYKVNTIIITPELREKILKYGVRTFATGGLVTGPKVPNTKENPADRVDSYTGRPYSDQMARLGLQDGGDVTTITKTNEDFFTPEEIAQQELEYKKIDSDLNRMNIINYLRDKGLNRNTISGILGNIEHETDGTYDYKMEQYDGPGRGLFMLDPGGDHVNQYNMFLDRNKRQDSMEAQLDYFYESIYDEKSPALKSNGSGNARKLRKIFEQGSVEEITEAITSRWERPKDYLNRKQNPEAWNKNLNDRIFRANRLQDVIDKMFIDYPEEE